MTDDEIQQRASHLQDVMKSAHAALRLAAHAVVGSMLGNPGGSVLAGNDQHAADRALRDAAKVYTKAEWAYDEHKKSHGEV